MIRQNLFSLGINYNICINDVLLKLLELFDIKFVIEKQQYIHSFCYLLFGDANKNSIR